MFSHFGATFMDNRLQLMTLFMYHTENFFFIQQTTGSKNNLQIFRKAKFNLRLKGFESK